MAFQGGRDSLEAELRASQRVVEAAREWVQAEEAPMTQPLGPGDYAIQRAGGYVAVKDALAEFDRLINDVITEGK